MSKNGWNQSRSLSIVVTKCTSWVNIHTYTQGLALNSSKSEEMLGSVGAQEWILKSEGLSLSYEAYYSCVTSYK